MKTFLKINLLEWHINPIVRDLALVAVSGLFVAISVISVIAMLASRY